MQKTKSLILGILCLIFGLSQSQWLETTIYLSDSLSGMAHPQAFT
jgi:hypothetical protein